MLSLELWYRLSSRILPHSSHLCAPSTSGEHLEDSLFYCQLGSPALVNPESHVKGVHNQTLMMWDSSVVLETDQGSPLGEGQQGPHGRRLGQLFSVALLCGPQYRA